MKKIFWLSALLILLCSESCTYNALPDMPRTITLISYDPPFYQSRSQFETGIYWLLSYLGAELSQENMSKSIQFIGNNKVIIDFRLLGFSVSAGDYLQKLIQQIRRSEEYQLKGGIDAGRFFALCFNSTAHYYQITQAPLSFENFIANRQMTRPFRFLCDTSSIADYSRDLQLIIGTPVLKYSCFIAEEGNGRISSGTFVRSGIREVFDFMPNGQPRFMLYDPTGQLYVPNKFIKAGKPANCMWCHESRLQPLFSNTPDLLGSISMQTFDSIQQYVNTSLHTFHEANPSAIDFKDKHAHTQGEWIYLAYYEPSAARLAAEWGISTAMAIQKLTGINTHINAEFPNAGELYYRKDVKHLNPYTTVEVAEDMRQTGKFEPPTL